MSSTLAFALILILPLAASGASLSLEDPSAVSTMNRSGANYRPPADATLPDGPFTVSSRTSEGITGISPAPEPPPAAMFGTGLLSLIGLLLLRKRTHLSRS